MDRRIIAAVAIAPIVVLAAACGSSQPSSTQADQRASNTQLNTYQANQPIPYALWSQYRQTLIDVEGAQIHGVATTSFFFNQGNPIPYKVCPSIGFPVASTSQLTNPQQTVGRGSDGITSIGQLEPNGTFTGESTGTYVTCVTPTGTKYVVYAEGFVHTEGGPAEWDAPSNSIKDIGAPTVVTQGGR